MANVFQPRLIQVRTLFTVEGSGDRPENITWWLQNTGPVTLSDLTTQQGIVDSDYAAFWAGSVGSSSAQYIGSIISSWESDTGPVVNSVGSMTPVTGSHSGLAAAQVCALMSGVGPQRYKGGHPRIYLPHIAQSVLQDDRSLTATAVADLESGWNAFGSAMAAGSPSWVTVNYRYRNNPLKAVVMALNNYNPNSIIATQRRRVRRVAHT